MPRILFAIFTMAMFLMASGQALAKGRGHHRSHAVHAFSRHIATHTAHRHFKRTRLARRGGRRHGYRAYASAGPLPALESLVSNGSSLISRMVHDLGTNPTGWSRQWCAVYLRMALKSTGHSVSGTDARAISFLHYGSPSHPAPGSIGVLPNHVIVVEKVVPGGVIALSGNHGHRVGRGFYPMGRILAFRAPA